MVVEDEESTHGEMEVDDGDFDIQDDLFEGDLSEGDLAACLDDERVSSNASKKQEVKSAFFTGHMELVKSLLFQY